MEKSKHRWHSKTCACLITYFQIATKGYLGYYGADMATDNSKPINVHMPHRQTVRREKSKSICSPKAWYKFQTFKYYEDYLTKYVEGVVGASMERHDFCHTDRPEEHYTVNGHFVIGKFVDDLETEIELTAFQV